MQEPNSARQFRKSRSSSHFLQAFVVAGLIATYGALAACTGNDRGLSFAAAAASGTATVDARLQPLVNMAVDDLAQRLKVDRTAISVVEAKAVIWPDRSLGCPQPGMVYQQVQQDGAFIRLRAIGREYSYHSGGSRAPFLCNRDE